MKQVFKKYLLTIFCLALTLSLVINTVYVTVADGTEPTLTDGESTSEYDDIVLNKTAKVNDDGTVTLNIETYLTGVVSFVEEQYESAADMVLLLDSSSSMEERFDGSTYKYTALRTAVTSFIDDAGVRYAKSDKTDHRIALVNFNDSASTLQGWTKLDSNGVKSLKNTVNNFKNYTGNTNIASALNQASVLFANPSYSGANTTRRKVVILFSDGYPAGSGDSYTESYAENGVVAAKKLKDAGVSVFTVGIFEGANSDITYGSKAAFSALGLNTNNIGKRGGNYECQIYDYADSDRLDSFWMLREGSFLVSSYTEYNQIIAANRFMNFVSSNYPKATTMGLSGVSDSQWWDWRYRSYSGYKITSSFSQESSAYYLTASNTDQLVNAFGTISSLIAQGGTSIQLNKTAVVKDIISDYFELPESVTKADIHTYTAKCIGKDENGFIFDNRVATNSPEAEEQFKSVDVNISDYSSVNDKRNVSVTGFDFSKNYVAYDDVHSLPCGYKLIIEFVIVPIEGFMGGNNIPTNNPESGIYQSENSEPLEKYPEPEVNLPTNEEELDLVFPDFTIYDGSSVCVDPIVRLADTNDLTYAFMDRKVYYKINGGKTELVNGMISPKETTVYPKNSIVVELIPKENKKDTSDGDEAEKKTFTNEEDFTIYVLEPYADVSAKDVSGVYGEAYTLGDGANVNISLRWKEKNNLKTEDDISEGVFKPFTASDLTVKYTLDGFNGKIPKNDTFVNMSVVSAEDGTALDSVLYTSYYTTCSYDCNDTPRKNGKYKIHTSTGTLEIKNTIKTASGIKNETFVFNVLKDGVLYTTVSVNPNNTVKLKELPVGTYKVVPASDWAWRYSSEFKNSKDEVVLTSTNLSGSVECINTAKNSGLLGSFCSPVKNIFSK